MKNNLLFGLFVAVCFFYFPQQVAAQSNDNEDEVVKIDRANMGAYREGEILVKFKSDGAVQMRAPQRKAFATTKVSAVDQLLNEIGVDSVEQLMPRTGHKNVGRRVRAYNGQEVVTQDLSKLYRLTLKAEKAQDIHQAIDRLKASDEVEFAEPNYLVYAMALPYDDSIPTMDSATYVSEPLYSQQWGLEAINLPGLWNKPKRSSKRPVIAILDTGVDIEHPDLAANIWTNTAEANGIAGQDDDANGYKDDIHGWSFIDNHSVTGDFNGHGTHCAGIAAAVGNNGIGITGANPDALIMPVTVMQSNGTGDVATIVKGIDYAAANGADVISMSIGGYGYSLAEEQALGRAYADAVLVAAAGNDNKCIIPHFCPINKRQDNGPLYPAALSFVLGVEASANASGALASFSNYDEDGPIYSSFGEEKLYNYELRAPGVSILSTFPGGRYKNLNGTSMACPLVAGAISRLIQCKEILSQEILFGDLIHTRNGNIDMLATYNITDADRHPELSLVTNQIVDTIDGDGDGRIDAGETIEIYPIIKNAWGQAENVRFWVKTGFDNQGSWVWDDTTLVTHLQDTAYFGKPLSSYAKATSLNPWRLQISPDCADGRQINLTLFATCDNTSSILSQQIVLTVENGVEIGGMLTEDLTLYPNVHYIVTNNLAVPSGVTLTIKPGTVLKFKSGTGLSMTSGAILNAVGTPDSMIVFTSADGEIGNIGPFSFYNSPNGNEQRIFYGIFENLHNTSTSVLKTSRLSDCIIKDVSVVGTFQAGYYILEHERLNVYNINRFRSNTGGGGFIFNNCNIVNINEKLLNKDFGFIQNSNIINVELGEISNSVAVLQTKNPSYWGSSREDIVRKHVYDINNGYGFLHYDFSNMLTRPSAEAHGIVWKILVDSIDAQDEFELLPPIGVGTHRCDVYFNRAMDTVVTPTISFGVRKPYTQHQVADNGSWSADSTIYTAYFTITDKSVTDGLNTFYVYGAEDDEHFEIPEENFRFKMEVAAAGSMSTGLMAEAGLGKVTLTWETDEEDFADLMGYHIYRWSTDTIWNSKKTEFHFDTLCINSTLIDSEDSVYVDYDVVPGKAYYYVIRQVTTSLSSYDLSNAVTATPLTAIKGDANGSMSVDVADVITEVNYITRQNPQPFIFEAADVNSDNQVNVIDVVATVNLILNPQSGTQAVNEGNTARYYIENGILYVESDVVLGGVQCAFNAEKGHTFTPLDALSEFEKVGTWQTDEQYMFMAYSMSGKTIGVGKTALLQIGDAEMTSIVLSDAQGHNVVASPQASTDLDGTLFMPCTTKYIEDGSLYIKMGERIYNVMGTLIR